MGSWSSWSETSWRHNRVISGQSAIEVKLNFWTVIWLILEFFHSLITKFDVLFSINPYPAVPTVESSIGRTPVSENAVAGNSKAYNTYDPSSQHKYPANKYVVAENIQNAIRQQSAYAQVCNETWSVFTILILNSIIITFQMHFFQSMTAADPFYGPIVARIDSILNQYGAYIGEHCKEWLVCNMYKNPSAFSPHSNFLSAELSR